MKKLTAKVKSMDVSASTPGVDAGVLQDLRDEIAYAKGAAEDAKATADEAKKESGEAKDAASEAYQAVVPVGVSVSEGVDSDRMKKDVRSVKYKMKKLQRKAKETVISVVPEVVSPVERGALFPPCRPPPSHSLTRPVPLSDVCLAFSFCLLAQFS
jgi:hypothetical protein